MKITISGSGNDGEGMITQIIEDMLKINGLSVKSDEAPEFFYGGLSIDQIDRKLNLLKKQGVTFQMRLMRDSSEKKPILKKKPSWNPSIEAYPFDRYMAAVPAVAAIIPPGNIDEPYAIPIVVEENPPVVLDRIQAAIEPPFPHLPYLPYGGFEEILDGI